MMKILLPVSLLFMFADEESDVFNLIFGYLFLSLVCVMGIVAPYTGVGYLYADGLGFSLILLTLWIVALMFIVSGNTADFCGMSEFHSMMSWLCFSLVWAFMSGNFFLFYFFFEVTLVPITLMILGWGYQPERLQASFYLFLYTVAASLPLLVIIFILSVIGGHVSFFLSGWGGMGAFNTNFLWVLFIIAFLVKVPVYFFHLWLPKAHVESPLAGSMILAGVLLKLGGYGLIRVFHIYPMISYSWMGYSLGSLALWGGAVCGFICLRQVDVKCLIAYSSITHMSVMIGGVMSNSFLGISGAVMMMFSHGLVSSSMFLGAFMMYKVVSSRMIYLIKGFLSVSPFFSFSWFLSMAANMGAPPTINLFSEVMLAGGLMKMSLLFLPVLGACLFFSAAYSLFLYTGTQNGGISSSLSGCFSFFTSDYVCLFLHLFPAYMMVVCSGSFFYGLG